MCSRTSVCEKVGRQTHQARARQQVAAGIGCNGIVLVILCSQPVMPCLTAESVDFLLLSSHTGFPIGRVGSGRSLPARGHIFGKACLLYEWASRRLVPMLRERKSIVTVGRERLRCGRKMRVERLLWLGSRPESISAWRWDVARYTPPVSDTNSS